MFVSIIAAVSSNNIIGTNNSLPWRLPTDMKFFKQTTQGHAVLMGRKTYQSIGRPLPNRNNYVVSRNQELKIAGCCVVNSVKQAIEYCEGSEEIEMFILGGGQIYEQAIRIADRLYITEVDCLIDGDTSFPQIARDQWERTQESEWQQEEKDQYPVRFVRYSRK